jgi:hypothetical protein
VTTTLSPPIRILALVGVLAAIGLGILLFTHSRSDSGSSSSAVPETSHANTQARTQSPVKPVAKPVKPRVVLLPGLPAQVAHALRFSKVVVVAVYAHGAKGDKTSVAEAHTGAKAAHAGFVAVNVMKEKTARTLGKFAGTDTTPPTFLVVKRPGKIVNRLSGYVDNEVVAQAALNAGAGR